MLLCVDGPFPHRHDMTWKKKPAVSVLNWLDPEIPVSFTALLWFLFEPYDVHIDSFHDKETNGISYGKIQPAKTLGSK